MTDDRMALIEALRQADGGNFLRSLAETVLQILTEADREGMIGAGRYERTGERSAWRNGYRDRTLDTRLGQLSLRSRSSGPGAASRPSSRRGSHREGLGLRHPGGVDRRGLDAESRRPRAGDGAQRDQQEPGLEAVQGDRRAGRRLPEAAARRRLALPLARCDLPQGARGRAHRLGRRDSRHGGEHRRPARDRRPAHRPVGGRALPGRLPQGSGAPRAEGREARRLRRARGPQGSDPACHRRDVAKVSRAFCPQRARLRAARSARRDPPGLHPARPQQRRRGLAPRRRPVPRPLAKSSARSWTTPGRTCSPP